MTGKKQKWDRLLGLLSLALIAAAWFVGASREGTNLEPFLKQALPEAAQFEQETSGTYSGWSGDPESSLVGYIALGTAQGYGGQLKTAVALDESGRITGLVLIEHRESASFLRRVLGTGILDKLNKKIYSDPFEIGRDIDGITGATLSTRALADSVRRAARTASSRHLGLLSPPEPAPQIKFGLPEIILLFLFILGIVGRRRSFKFKKSVRWASMIFGLLLIGFLYNSPFTLALVNRYILGFWPAWQLHLYWYILIGGIIFLTFFDRKNPYCDWFCPFGAAQECLGIIGGTKLRLPDKGRIIIRWIQRGVALAAILLALIYRNPSLSSFEVFGTFFRLIGTNLQFILLGLFLVAALFLRRPWCQMLCPLRPVTDYIRMAGIWVRELFKRQKRLPTES